MVSAIAGITMATLIALSTLALGMSAKNTLMIRDAAIEAANRSALAEGQGQREYLMQLLDESLPTLARFEIEETNSPEFSGYRVRADLPGSGFIPFSSSVVEVAAVREAFI